MDARRSFAFACLVCIGALILQGCGGGGDATTTTVTMTTATTTTTTTVTTVTTVTGAGGCIGKDVKTFDPGSGTKFNWGEACFCFYTGQCVDIFLEKYGCWNVSVDISWCQQKWCGQAPFSQNDQYVSFFDQKHDWKATNPNILTIPKIWFLNINHLKDQCTDDKGLAEVTNLLLQGRNDFANSGHTSGVPQWQCLHVQRWVGVEWLHLHNFNGEIKAEELPDSAFPYNPPHALCRSGSSDAKESAQWMLDHIPKTLEQVV